MAPVIWLIGPFSVSTRAMPARTAIAAPATVARIETWLAFSRSVPALVFCSSANWLRRFQIVSMDWPAASKSAARSVLIFTSAALSASMRSSTGRSASSTASKKGRSLALPLSAFMSMRRIDRLPSSLMRFCSDVWPRKRAAATSMSSIEDTTLRVADSTASDLMIGASSSLKMRVASRIFSDAAPWSWMVT
jgi:hypothetical protein